MKIKTSHIILGIATLSILSQGENVRSSLEKGSQVRQEQADFSDRIRQNKIEEKEAEKLSKVALARYKSNCILVVDQATGQESFLQPNSLVIDTRLGRPIRAGATVCNRIGDTAIIAQSGVTADIARVITADIPAFKKLLEKRR